jgi:hypothetical protein
MGRYLELVDRCLASTRHRKSTPAADEAKGESATPNKEAGIKKAGG